MVQWYTEYANDVTIDHGLVVELDEDEDTPTRGVYIQWFSNDGNGWFDIGHPAIGVVSESR